MSNFKTALIEDARIAMITDEEVYGVQSSASQSTYQQFKAISTSNSSVVFNVQIPSENILIDRHVLLKSNLAITVSATGVPMGEGVEFQYGVNSSMQAFPLNSLMQTTQLTLNNVSTSTNTADVLAPLMRMNDIREMARWNSLTPSLPDCQYGAYGDALFTNNNPMAAFNTSGYDPEILPRGSFKVDVVVQHQPAAGGPTDASLISTSPNDTWKFFISGTYTEPFLALSPFINTNPENQAGLVGINNLSLVLNIDATCKRVFSSSCHYITGVTLGNAGSGQAGASPTGFSETQLMFNFLSLQPEQYAKISTRNIVPYMDFPRYLTASGNNPTIPAYTQSSAISSQSIQLNQVPDMIIIVARMPLGDQNWANTSSFLAIKNISVNFNNSSGLLATASQQDLYNLSVRNGSAQSFYEFCGQASTNDNATGGVTLVPTTGSVLVLNPCYDFSLPSYLSASSLGQYQLQFNITLFNQFPDDIQPEIMIICCNSGLFSTQQGTSQIFTGILTKEQVLRTKEQNPVPHLDSAEYARLVGGKMSNRGMSSILGLLRHAGHHKQVGGVMSAGAASGGAASGGAASGGHRSKASKHY